MGRSASSRRTRTYLGDDAAQPEVHAVAEALSRHGSLASGKPPAVVSADGSRVDLTPLLREALQQVVESLAMGNGVRVTPLNPMLTTREAAEFLDVSPRTVHAMLERAEFGARRPNRHRYIRLEELVDYQQRSGRTRRAALDRMAREAQEYGLYDQAVTAPTSDPGTG